MLQALHPLAGTDAASEAERHAYNAAFHELELNWHWDADTFARLQRHGRVGLRAYLETEQAHLLRAYPVDFLVDAIETTKARCHAAMAPAACTAPGPLHAARLAA
jgi:hypothetical protein